ncbi:STAS domain-containing protein [Spirillospora sp. NPDC127200]
MDDFTGNTTSGPTGDDTGSATALRLSARHRDGAFTITATGALDFATAPQLLDCLKSVFTQLAHLPRRPVTGKEPGGDRSNGSGNGRANHDQDTEDAGDAVQDRAENGAEGGAPVLRVRAVVIDASGVVFIDAFGLGTLVTLANTARRHHLSFALAAPSPAVHRLLAITGMDDRFTVCPAPGLEPDQGLGAGG